MVLVVIVQKPSQTQMGFCLDVIPHPSHSYVAGVSKALYALSHHALIMRKGKGESVIVLEKRWVGHGIG